MLRTIRFAMILLALAGLFSWSSSSALAEEAKTQDLSEEMSRLVPDDTFIIVYTPSVVQLQKELSTVAAVADTRAAGLLTMFGPEPLIKMMLDPKSKIRWDLPIALVVRYGKTLEDDPHLALILGVEREKPDTGKPGATPTLGGFAKPDHVIRLEGTDWVSLCWGDAYEPSAKGTPTPAVSKSLLPGILSISFDQAGLVERFGPEIQEKLADSMKSGNKTKTRAHLDGVMAGILVNDFKRWDLGMTLRGTEVDYCIQYVPSKESWISPGDPALGELGSRMPSNMPFQMVITRGSMDQLQAISNFFNPLLGEFGEKMMPLMKLAGEMIEQVQGGVGVSVGFSDHGFNMVKVMEVKDVKATLEIVDAIQKALTDAEIGFNIERMPVLIGGERARAFRVKFDKEQFEKMFPGPFKGPGAIALPFDIQEAAEVMQATQGTDGFIIRFISKDNWIAVVTGEPKLLGRARRSLGQAGMTSPALDASIKKTYAPPTWAVAVDLRAYTKGVFELVSAHPALGETLLDGEFGDAMMGFPSSPPVVLDVVGSATANACQVTLSTDIAKWAGYIKDMQKTMAAVEEKRKGAKPPAEPGKAKP